MLPSSGDWWHRQSKDKKGLKPSAMATFDNLNRFRRLSKSQFNLHISLTFTTPYSRWPNSVTITDSVLHLPAEARLDPVWNMAYINTEYIQLHSQTKFCVTGLRDSTVGLNDGGAVTLKASPGYEQDVDWCHKTHYGESDGASFCNVWTDTLEKSHRRKRELIM